MRFSPHPFSLRQLQYAAAVAQTLSFRKAATLCHVSQPSLSAQLGELEKGLGVRLFERDQRRVLVTAAGRDLLERARQILLAADDLAEAGRCAGNPLAGRLRVGIIPTLSPYLLPSLAPALRRAFPDLNVVWVEDKTASLVRGLELGDLEAAIVALEADLGDVEREEIARDAFLLAVPPGHWLSRKESPVRAAELKGESVLLLDEGHCFREQALSFCNAANTREREFRATSLATLAQMAAAGAGVTLLPELAAPTETQRTDLVLRPLIDPLPFRTVGWVWRKRSPLGPILVRIAAASREAYPAKSPSRTRR